ncbi:MAG: NHL repeat-containing protein [Sphingobacteriales bacterium]
MKKPLLPLIFFVSFIILFTVSSCKKTGTTDTSIPVVTTQDVILDLTTTTAQSGGTITSIGGAALTADGVVYSTTTKTPTLDDIKSAAGLITTSYTFTNNLTGLTANTTYYLRAYATNEFGTAYGAVITFTTSSTLSFVTGVVTTFAGNGTAGFLDGTGTGAEFNNPTGLAMDASGNIYISDTFNNRIRKIASDGTVTTIAGNGTAGYVDSKDGDPEFYAPQGLAIDPTGNIFVADYGNNVIREITVAGTVSTYAGNGNAGFVDGAASKVATFNGPAGVAFDTKGNLFVADRNNNMIRKISPAGGVSLVAGVTRPGYTNLTVDSAIGSWGAFKKPNGIAVDATGNIYVADDGNNAIRLITPAGVITTIAGGPVQTALVGYPSALCVDATGNLFISDESGRIIELTSARALYVLAGASNVTGYADGTGAAAIFNTPQGIVVDKTGNNIYIADFNNSRIRKLVVQTTD